MARENIDVTVELHDRLSLPAERAEDAVDDLGDEVAELNAELAATDVSSRRFVRAMATVRRAAGSANREVDETNRNTKKFALLAKLAGSGGDLISDKFLKAGKSAGKFWKILMKLTLLQGVILVLSLLATVIAAVGAAAFAALAGLSPLVGLLGGIPGLVIGAATAFGAVLLGVRGLGDAVKALGEGDVTKAREALAGLTDEGRYLAYQINDLVKGPLKDLQDRTQAALAPRFSLALENAVGLFPLLQRGVVRTAAAIGDLAISASEATKTDLFRGQLSRVMRTNTYSLTNGGKAAGYFALAMLAIADAFRPVERVMSEYLLQGAEFINTQTQAGNASGGLTEFFKDAWRLGKAVGQVLADLAVGLYNVGKESDVMGELLGGSLADAAADWRAWTSSVEGQDSIRSWFEDSVPVVQQVLGLLRDLGVMFGSLSNHAELAPLIGQIRSELLPAVDELTSAVSGDLGPALITGAEAVVKFLTVLSASPVADVIAAIAAAALLFADGLNALPYPLKIATALILGLFFATSTLAKGLLFLKGLSIVTFFSGIVTGAQAGMIGMQGMARATGALSGAMMGARLGMAGMVASLGGPLGIALIAATVLVGKFMMSQQKAKAAADELSSSLDAQTGAITENTRAIIAKQLEESGALAAARELGFGLDFITDVAMGNAAAIEELTRRNVAWRAAADDGNETAKAQRDAWQKMIAGVDDAGDALDSAKSSTDLVNEALGKGKYATKAYAADVEHTASALDEQADAARRARNAAIELNDTLISQQRTMIGFRQNIADATDTLSKNAATLNLHTQAGRDNQSALLDVAEAASAVENKAARVRAIKEATDFIANWADQAGMGAKEARDYARDLFNLGDTAKDLPASAAVDVEVLGAQAALTALNDIRDAAFQVKRENIDLLLDPTGGGVGRRHRRDGGPVWGGEPFTVGEVGPELLLTGSGVSVIGRHGQEQRTFSEPGYVLPNEFYEAARAEANAPMAAAYSTPVSPFMPDAPAGRNSDELAPMPPINVNLPHSGHMLTEADVEAAALRAWRRFQQEQEERR